jgi:hypothetical protein
MQKLVIETTSSKKEFSRDIIPFANIKLMREQTKEDGSKLLVVYFGTGNSALAFKDGPSRFGINNGASGARIASIGEVVDEFLRYGEVYK